MKKKALIKPFLKWAGGKRQLLDSLIENMPSKLSKNYCYYEPFLGGGALFFEIQPQNAVISDSNLELINCYQVIRDEVEILIEDLKKHFNNEDYYYKIRDWDRQDDFKNKSSVERCSRIIFLNKTCYNGLFRVNSQGQFNVPFGRYKNPNFLEEGVLRGISQYLNSANIKIIKLDFEEAVKSAKKGDFVYFDPPYDPISNTASFTGYDMHKFDQSQQERLKQVCDKLTSIGCKVLLSNSDTTFIRKLYQDKYKIVSVYANRAINSNPSCRGKITELLIKNYE
jgi:DNA adenine methylase